MVVVALAHWLLVYMLTEARLHVQVCATEQGVWNALHLWPELDFGPMGGGVVLRTHQPQRTAGPTEVATDDGTRDDSGDGEGHGSVYYTARSFKQGAVYVDARAVPPGQQVGVGCSCL